MPVKQISLYYKDGSSDKVYHAQIEQESTGYLVNFQYGRRGSTLTAGTKTKSPIDLEKAEEALAKLYKEKTAKGYTEGESGAVFQSQDLEDRITGIVPQLLNDMSLEEVDNCFQSDQWFMQEKFDGRRLLIKKVGEEVTGINKKGLSILIPESVADIVRAVPEDIILDGEIVGEKYNIFDLLEFNGLNLRSDGAEERYERLTQIKVLTPNVVKAFFTEKDKRKYFDELEDKEKEGAVFKRKGSPYVSGRPASGGNQLKYKFWASATVEVLAQHKTKRSVTVGVYDGQTQMKMGNVTIPANYDIPAVGDIVEVIYLYCHVGGALYQSKYKGVRDDQVLSDCSYQQIKFKASDEEEELDLASLL